MSDRTIAALQDEVHQTASAKGFHDDWDGSSRHVASKLMLVVSELVEAMEEARVRPTEALAEPYYHDGKPEGFGVELADAVIRILDLAGLVGVDLEALVLEKMEFNRTRPAMHGGKRF